MRKTIFEIARMDCPAEENLISLKLDSISGIKKLEFNLTDRKLTIFHEGPTEPIEKAIHSLELSERMIHSSEVETGDYTDSSDQKKLLWIVLAINLSFFFIEMGFGLISRSMGLVGDSLDMLADAFVYGISLLAVGSTVVRKKKIARIAGYFQITLAILGFAEILRRVIAASTIPDYTTMIIVSALALVANVICLILLQRSRGKEEAHMKASIIFTSNDVIINLGVIAAGMLVNWLNSSIPDLIIGAIVFVLVMQGAWRILRLGK
ncbi:MAG: cation transporter [Saprospiraceae bacterium]|nr:cation transporter [Saprospiraceae bacterium]